MLAMDNALKRKLAQLDLLESLPSGETGVRVTLQHTPRLTESSRAGRRAFLDRRFSQIGKSLSTVGCRVEIETVSVSSQTVEAVIPIDQFSPIEDRLKDEHIRLDVLMDRSIVH
jgi:hypothetical protein